MTEAHQHSPVISVVVPTYGRSEYLRSLLYRLSTELREIDAGSVEVLVCDNHSADETDIVLSEARSRWSWLRTVSPDRHFISAEENLYFAMSHANGEYIWPFGDDDEFVGGSFKKLLHFLDSRGPDFALFNVATMNIQGNMTRSRFVDVSRPEVWWPIERIVAGVGFMGLSSCFSAVVARREPLMAADWSAHLARSSVYAHVVAYLEAFKEKRCVFVDDVMVVARQGATGLAEFSRLTSASGRAVSWPWAVGLPKHLAHLMDSGITAPDFASRTCERGEPRSRLLPSLIRMTAQQLAGWLEERSNAHRMTAEDLDLLTRISAAAPLAERECVLELFELWKLIASLLGEDGAPASGAALQPFAGVSSAVLERILSFGPEILRGERADVLTSFVQALGQGDRNNAPESGARPLTLGALLAKAPPSWRREAESVIVDAAHTRFHQVEARVGGGLTPDCRALAADSLGMHLMALGGLVVALPAGRSLTHDEREDINLVDMRGVGEVLAAETWEELEQKRRALSAEIAEDLTGQETFAGWRLGLRRGRQVAIHEDKNGEAHTVRASGNRLSLRRSVLNARRDLELLESSARTSVAMVRPARELDRTIISERSPLLFDTDWYSDTYPIAAEAIRNGIVDTPLQHWLEVGGRYGLDPMVWFDSDDYFAAYPRACEAVDNGDYPTALHHYLAEGAWMEAVPFYPFDPRFYASFYEDARQAIRSGVTPLEHFLHIGLAEGRRISAYFDESAYLLANPDVEAAVKIGALKSGLHHYRYHGRREGRPIRRGRHAADPLN